MILQRQQSRILKGPGMTTLSDRTNKQAVKATEDLQEMAGEVCHAAQHQAAQLRDDAAEYYEKGRHKILDMACSCEHAVRQRPFQSLLIAAGVGLLFGRFWRRR
jgi:ElaB/YqjD/DUF883 family membrane-anchored ribosome-binding protein